MAISNSVRGNTPNHPKTPQTTILPPQTTTIRPQKYLTCFFLKDLCSYNDIIISHNHFMKFINDQKYTEPPQYDPKNTNHPKPPRYCILGNLLISSSYLDHIDSVLSLFMAFFLLQNKIVSSG